VSVSSDWYGEGSGKTEVSELDASRRIEQKILRFEITVQDAMAVTEHNAL